MRRDPRDRVTGAIARMGKIDTEVEALAEQLRGTCGAQPDDEPSTIPNFWAHRPSEQFPPGAIVSPDAYQGGDRVSIACTQTDLPAKAQRALVENWCSALPAFSDLRYVWFQSRTTQALFEAACRLPNLEGLYVKWSGIDDLAPLQGVPTLLNLHLGSSPGVTSIAPLAGLRQLLRLDLENLKSVQDLTPLSGLTNLVALSFLGEEFKRNAVASFAPLAPLSSLTWLHLGALRTHDMSLRPLAALTGLEYLAIGNVFAIEEFAYLSARLPHTLCNWLKPYARFHKSVFPCRTCRENWKVMLSGKGRKLLCPTCDAVPLARHVLLYQKLRDASTT